MSDPANTRAGADEAVTLRQALEVLLAWAESADRQIHAEYGFGPYEEDDKLTAARDALRRTATAKEPT